MYKPEDIKNHFGEELYTYVQNKDRGGSSNRKGNHYENSFAIYKIAEYSESIFESGFRVFIKTQVQAFVDDLVIQIENNNLELQHYQLKNSSNVSWGNDNQQKSICSDFKNQHELNRIAYPQYNCEVNLVISDESKYNTLGSKIPASIKKYSNVVFFDYDENFIKTIEKNEKFKQFIYYLSAFEQPEPDKLETIAQTLIGAWCIEENQDISIEDFIRKVQKQRYSFIRSFEKILDIKQEVKDIFNQIPDFKY